MNFRNKILIYSGTIFVIFVILLTLISIQIIRESSDNQFKNIKESITSYNRKLLYTFVEAQNGNLTKQADLIIKEAEYVFYSFDHGLSKGIKNEAGIKNTLLRLSRNNKDYIISTSYIDVKDDVIYIVDKSGVKKEAYHIEDKNIVSYNNLFVEKNIINNDLKHYYIYGKLGHWGGDILRVEVNLDYFSNSLIIDTLSNEFDFNYILMTKEFDIVTSNIKNKSDKKIMISRFNNLSNNNVNFIEANDGGSFSVKIDSSTYNVTFIKNTKTDWNIFLVTPESVIKSNYSSIKSFLLSSGDQLMSYFLLIVLTLLSLFLFINSVVIKNLVSPMNKLIKQAKSLRDQDYSSAMIKVTNHGDEIEQLSHVYSEASTTIKMLIEGLEDEVKERTQQFEDASRSANNANHQKTILLSNVSHEIRTPLNAIVGYTTILNESAQYDCNEHYLNGITHASHTILSIVNDLLDFERVKKNNYELHEKKAQLNKILNDINIIFMPISLKKGISFKINNNVENEFVHMIIDELRFKQAISNIITNAIKFTNIGEVILDVRISEDNIIVFRVIDTGIGIPEDKIKDIFNNYEQVNQDDQNKGFGLGLTITKTILDLMKAKLSVESQLDKGSEFIIELPFTELSHNEAQINPNHIDLKNEKYKNFNNITALIVDDVEFNREILQFQLERLGITCILAESGFAALNKYKNNKLDIIFTDVSMPGMDGIELSKKIKILNSELPIVAVTARATVQEESGMNNYFDYYITKPIDSHQILSALICTLNI